MRDGDLKSRFAATQKTLPHMFTSELAPRTVVQVRHLHQKAGKAMRITAALILTALTITPPAAAQEKMDTAVYKVEFNIHDGSDGPAKADRRSRVTLRAASLFNLFQEKERKRTA